MRMKSDGELTIAECFVSAWWRACKGKGNRKWENGKGNKKELLDDKEKRKRKRHRKLLDDKKRGKKRDTEMQSR